jgi:hypothetical protein
MTCKVLAVGLLLAVLAASVAWGQGQDAPPPGPDGSAAYGRPGAQQIHSTAEEILADPRYRPRKSLAQWFMEQMRGWGGPNIDFGSGWVRLLLWVICGWCLIALIAILVHIGWFLFTMLRPTRPAVRLSPGSARLHEHLRLPYEALLAMAREAADSGDYGSALHWTMLALLRSLADRRLISLHPSKTNGDYVREFSQASDSGPLMARFTADFDHFTYGTAGCSRSDFSRMKDAFARIQSHAVSQA